MKAVYINARDRFDNKFGSFSHKDWLGVPFGSKVYARAGGRGWVHLLAPSPDLWSLVLPHRTQILYIADISMVCHYLDLAPGSVVLESGTGSASLTHSLIRAVAPTGHVHTFEFHAGRTEDARKELARNGLSAWVTVRQRNIEEQGFPCGAPGAAPAPLAAAQADGAAPSQATSQPAPESGAADGSTAGAAAPAPGPAEGDAVAAGTGAVQGGPAADASQAGEAIAGAGADVVDLTGCADAVFLDLPAPHKAIPSAAKCLKPDGRLCSFSPCIEQVQRTAEALELHGFTDLQTVECLLRQYEVYKEVLGMQLGAQQHHRQQDRQRQQTAAAPPAAAAAVAGGAVLQPADAQGHGPVPDAGDDTAMDAHTGEPATKRSKPSGPAEDAAGQGHSLPQPQRPQQPAQVVQVVARPAMDARGHTGYLTFARKFVGC